MIDSCKFSRCACVLVLLVAWPLSQYGLGAGAHLARFGGNPRVLVLLLLALTLQRDWRVLGEFDALASWLWYWLLHHFCATGVG